MYITFSEVRALYNLTQGQAVRVCGLVNNTKIYHTVGGKEKYKYDKKELTFLVKREKERCRS
jgi:hypothetical protein